MMIKRRAFDVCGSVLQRLFVLSINPTQKDALNKSSGMIRFISSGMWLEEKQTEEQNQ